MSQAPTAIDARRATRAVRAGIDRDPAYGAVTPPLVLSSNFSFAGFAEKRQYDYTRSGNPTRDLLGETLAELEGGAGGVVTATGMGAITLALNALLQPGDRLVVPHDCYGGSWRLFNALAKKGAFELISFDLDPHAGQVFLPRVIHGRFVPISEHAMVEIHGPCPTIAVLDVHGHYRAMVDYPLNLSLHR